MCEVKQCIENDTEGYCHPKNLYARIYSYLDDGSDPEKDFTRFDIGERNLITYTEGNGSVVFPLQGKGEPYVSYESNEDLKYQD